MIHLRGYQKECCEKAWAWLTKTKESCVLDLCTGAGKSYIIAELAYRILEKSKKRVLVLAPTAEIVKQNREKFLLTGQPASMFCASAGAKSCRHPVIFGSPKTVHNAIHKFQADISAIFIDECHILGNTIKEIVSIVSSHNTTLRVIGLSGTPYRTGTGYVYKYDDNDSPVNVEHAYFNKLVFSIKTRELIDKGFLCAPSLQHIDITYDTDKLERDKRRKFTDKSINTVFLANDKTSIIIKELLRITRYKACICTMIFASTVQHAQKIADMLHGDSFLVTKDINKTQRQRIIVQAKRGKVQFLVSVGTLTTGVDIPCVDCIAVLRATESPGLFQQIIGRGLRLSNDTNKTECLILDYGGNIERHCPDGDIFDPKVEINTKDKQQSTISAQCPHCGANNEFTARKNKEEFEHDEHGYFIDLLGNKILNDEEKAIPAHYGRRCFGQKIVNGASQRCGYRWEGKECKNPECKYHNDIAARYCEKCKEELVDPNDKLTLEYARVVYDPYQQVEEKVISWSFKKHIGKSGKETLRVRYNTNNHSIDVWYMPNIKHTWIDFCINTIAETADNVDKFIEKSGIMCKKPNNILVKKNKSGYFQVLAHS